MRQKLIFIMLVLVCACKKEKEENSNLEFPASTDYGLNILHDAVTTAQVDTAYGMPGTVQPRQYSMAAKVPSGKQLRIVLKNGGWGIRIAPAGPIGWTFATYDMEHKTQVFTARPGETNDLHIQFDRPYDHDDPDTVTVDYYIDNNLVSTKKIITYF